MSSPAVLSEAVKVVSIPYKPQDYQREVHESLSRYKVLDWGRRCGKSLFALTQTIREAVKRPGPYWFIGPTYRQIKSIAWRELKRLLKNDPQWKFNEVELRAEHPSLNTFIELKGADNEDSLRGGKLRGVVLDECAQMKANIWPEIIRPMLSDYVGWAIFISTPKGRNWFFDLYQKGLDKNAEAWKCWHYPTSANKYIHPDEIEEMKRDMSERHFKQEVLAEFLDDETGVFRGVDQCAVGEFEEPEKGAFYVMGVDLAKSEDFTVICVMDAKSRHLVHFERFQHVRWPDQKEKIQLIAKRYNNAKTIIDATGVGDAIFDDLQDADISIEPFKISNTSKNQLINKLVVSIEQRLITFPRVEELIEELKVFEYSITAEGRIKYSAPDGKHDDIVIALALANWGIRHDLYATRKPVSGYDEEVMDRVGAGTPVYEGYEYQFSPDE